MRNRESRTTYLLLKAIEEGKILDRGVWGSDMQQNLELAFALQCERMVNRDNTVTFQNLSLQIERVNWRETLAGCVVTLHQHLDGTISLAHGVSRILCLVQKPSQAGWLRNNESPPGQGDASTKSAYPACRGRISYCLIL